VHLGPIYLLEGNSPKQAQRWFSDALGLGKGDSPFPWQKELFRRFIRRELPSAIDLPTGIGKTSIMAIWLLARASGASLPRRLVYVVDRRAVVDQATEEAVRLRDFVERNPTIRQCLGFSDGRSLPISTLRGQHVDNREWLADPASPAIVVGTVDMIGSRLLFEGYGVSRKMRSYHGGLLGADTLLVLDEAHLIPPFEDLLRTIAEDAAYGPESEDLRKLTPAFKLLPLSATGRNVGGKAFDLTTNDFDDLVIKKRLEAKKHLALKPIQANVEDALAEAAWRLSSDGANPARILVYCDKREVATKTRAVIEKLAKADKKLKRAAVEILSELMVGARRVFERENLKDWLRDTGFLAGAQTVRDKPAFLFATSAGEVGVDLDADYMVCDLVAWERMVQRLGRVNRRGEPVAHTAMIEVLFESEPPDFQKALAQSAADQKKTNRAIIARVERDRATRKLLEKLPPLGADHFDASPGALRNLRLKAQENQDVAALLDAASTPAPVRPALSRALVDAWSMTSLKEHPGRPAITPWLRGWIDDDPPQTKIVWRKYLPVRVGAAPKDSEIEAFFDAAPPHISEVLETETFRVVQWLAKRADAMRKQDARANPALNEEDIVAFILTSAGDLAGKLRLRDLDKKQGKAKDAFEKDLQGRTLIVDRRLAGITNGLLDETCNDITRTADDGQDWLDGAVRFRINIRSSDDSAVAGDGDWYERLRFPVELSQEGELQRWLIIEKLCADAATEDDRSAGRPQLLDEHQSWTETRARALAKALGIGEYADMLGIAARLHDEGKQADRWQRAFNAPPGGPYAKTKGPINYALLDGYRHEFGSIPYAETHERLLALPPEQQDLALHLIAAHHGFARPVISTEGCEDAPPSASALKERAAKIAHRFARLQERWGPWGLAWWEALLRAADQQASRDNDAQGAITSEKR